MLRRRRLTLVFVALLALGMPLWLLSWRAEAEGQAVTLAVIVSKSSHLDDIALSDLRRAFQSEHVSSPDANKLIALNHPPNTPDRVAFDRIVLGMDPAEVARYWIDRRIRGGTGPPRSVDSLSTLRRVVAKLPGAIGYLQMGQLSGELKALKIDGKAPGEAGYPLVYSP